MNAVIGRAGAVRRHRHRHARHAGARGGRSRRHGHDPSTFDYEVAESAEHAVSLLGREDAKLLAGGHSLIPLLRLRFARPSLLVDIGRIAELSYVRDAGSGSRSGR